MHSRLTQLKQLEPLTYQLVKHSGQVKYPYEHAKFATLQPFTDAWKNYWPAYVQGSIHKYVPQNDRQSRQAHGDG